MAGIQVNYMAEAEEQEYAKLSYETAVYREQLKLLEREIQRVQLTSVDLATAGQTCQHLKNGEALVPIGGGAFIRSQISATKVLVPVGAGYLIDMESDKAVYEIHKRADSTKNAVVKLQEEYQKIVQKFQGATAQLQILQQRIAIDRRVDQNIGEDYI